MSKPRHSLIRHVAEQIQRDPEAYANTAKLAVVAKRIAQELGRVRMGGGPQYPVPEEGPR